jgi:ribosomal protein S18 acetylase RimI-like enzyme
MYGVAVNLRNGLELFTGTCIDLWSRYVARIHGHGFKYNHPITPQTYSVVPLFQERVFNFLTAVVGKIINP